MLALSNETVFYFTHHKSVLLLHSTPSFFTFVPSSFLSRYSSLLNNSYSFFRLMWPGKICPMESLSTCAVLEKATGLERKHCKGKIVPNNTASSNLNLLFPCCFCLLHCCPLSCSFSLTNSLNILLLTLNVHLFSLICHPSAFSSYLSLFFFPPLTPLDRHDNLLNVGNA